MSAAPTPNPPENRPAEPRRGVVDRVADALPGWMFLASGLVLLAAVALTPPWLTLREDAWRLSVMQAQSAALTRQAERYRSFHEALADDDPVMLERLAMNQLRLGIAGKWPLWVQPVEQETGDVGAWLSVPQPEIGRDVPAYAPVHNRLTRIVTGPARPALLGVGLLLMVAGVLFNPRSAGRRAATVSRGVVREPARRPAPPATRPLPA